MVWHVGTVLNTNNPITSFLWLFSEEHFKNGWFQTFFYTGNVIEEREKVLGCFHIIFAQILTAHNFCLTRMTASILIYANALGYLLSIKVKFVMRNMISICLCCCI